MTTVGAVLAAVLAAAFLATVLGLAGIFWVNARHASGRFVCVTACVPKSWLG